MSVPVPRILYKPVSAGIVCWLDQVRPSAENSIFLSAAGGPGKRPHVGIVERIDGADVKTGLTVHLRPVGAIEEEYLSGWSIKRPRIADGPNVVCVFPDADLHQVGLVLLRDGPVGSITMQYHAAVSGHVPAANGPDVAGTNRVHAVKYSVVPGAGVVAVLLNYIIAVIEDHDAVRGESGVEPRARHAPEMSGVY